MYVVGWNMPGYLPESDPETFDNYGDAAMHLIVTVHDWCEDDLQSVTWAPTEEQAFLAARIEDRYGMVTDAIASSEGPSFAMAVPDVGYNDEKNIVVWIARKEQP
jgi:hypothetical protein